MRYLAGGPLWLLVLLALLCDHGVLFAADTPVGQKASLVGQVLDEHQDRPLSRVNVTVDGTSLGTASDEDGRFRITELSPGEYWLTLSFVGYEDRTLGPCQLKAGTELDLGITRMRAAAIPLEEMVVTPGSFSIMGTGPASRQTLGRKDLQNMSFAEDITRAVSRLPGVASNDYSSKFTVRGGEADEVLMTLDGMELHEPFHQRDFSGGLFSIVDIEAVEGVELLTGGFSAEYGDRESAVFAMRTRHNRDGKSHHSMGLSALTVRGFSEGPLADGRGEYLVSARRGILDQAFQLVGFDEQIPFFYDMLGKVEYRLNPRQSIALHALRAGDQTGIRDISVEDQAHDIHDTRYTNSYGWLTFNSSWTPRLFTRSMLYLGEVDHKRHGDSEKPFEPSDKMFFKLLDQRSYTLSGFKQELDWKPGKNLQLKSGVDLRHLQSDYNYHYTLDDWRIDSTDQLFFFQDSASIRTQPSGNQLGLYASGRYRLTEHLLAEAGLRHDRADHTGDRLWSPRLGLAWALAPETTVRAAWGHYWQIQSINALDVNHGATQFVPAELSRHWVLGLEHHFDNGIELRLDGFVKQMPDPAASWQNLRDPWEVFPEARNDLALVHVDEARSHGIEFFLKRDQGGRFSWWLSYAWSRAEEHVTGIDFQGLVTPRTGWLPKINNQDHTLYADLNYRPDPRWLINVSWQYWHGLPYTDYTYRDTTLPSDSLHFYPVHGVFRGRTYPPYHRMDVRVNRIWQLDNSRLSAFLHLINVYNRENLKKFDVDVRGDDNQYQFDDNGNYVYFQDNTYWLGILPVLGVSWEF
ncbi:MAG: TonB-dependent receptor [Candidatus Delongbacteria bacterium]|nr:TonB-dependent receptor [Candidatus Delongbacteria bacterium]